MSLVYRLRHLATSSATRSAFARVFATTSSSASSLAGGFASSSSASLSRSKSSLAAVDGEEEDHHVESLQHEKPHESVTTVVTDETTPADHSSQYASTYNHSKSGTPSPWAVFDAWGAGADIVPPLAPEMEKLLEGASVKIPMSENERGSLAGETEILQAYDQLLQRKSSVHFGYPYNLMYDHAELYEFMKYSINNLGDPFVPSNYGVHSRQV